MKITAEELARHYGAMSDDELLSIDPGELHDLARACYQQELASRSLESASAETGDSPLPAEDAIVVATFTNQQAARMAQSALEAAGIACFIEQSDDGLQLTVGESQQRDAREVLKTVAQMSISLVEEWLTHTLAAHTVMIEDMLAEDDMVAARLTIDRKHQAVCFARIADGKVAETWHNFDELGLK